MRNTGLRFELASAIFCPAVKISRTQDDESLIKKLCVKTIVPVAIMKRPTLKNGVNKLLVRSSKESFNDKNLSHGFLKWFLIF